MTKWTADETREQRGARLQQTVAEVKADRPEVWVARVAALLPILAVNGVHSNPEQAQEAIETLMVRMPEQFAAIGLMATSIAKAESEKN